MTAYVWRIKKIHSLVIFVWIVDLKLSEFYRICYLILFRFVLVNVYLQYQFIFAFQPKNKRDRRCSKLS